MPLTSDVIRRRFAEGLKEERLGHSYLLTGSQAETLLNLAQEIASLVLKEDFIGHPDFYLVRPESKARRITVEQMRDLEKSLYLKPFCAPKKVAVIVEADRMCLGQAEAANAFLKTLEEPPNATLLLLLTTRPQLLLPTILSRCLRIDLSGPITDTPSAALQRLLTEWERKGEPPVRRAYARAALLARHWQELRAGIEANRLEPEDPTMEEEVQKALAEHEFQLARQETLAALQRWHWQREMEAERPSPQGRLALQTLEELQSDLGLGIDQALSVERMCLALEELI